MKKTGLNGLKKSDLSRLIKNKKNILPYFRLELIAINEGKSQTARDFLIDKWLEIELGFRKSEIYERIGDMYFKEEEESS